MENSVDPDQGYARKKYLGRGGGGGGGKTADDIFFYGWLVRNDFKLYGSLVSHQIKLHGWLVFRCVEGKERILSAKKERSFIKSSQKKAKSTVMAIFVYTQSTNIGCFGRILVKKRYRNKLPDELQSKRPQVKHPLVKTSPNWSKHPQKLVTTSPW